MKQLTCALLVLATAALGIVPAAADPFFFSTGNPNGLMATASRPDIPQERRSSRPTTSS